MENSKINSSKEKNYSNKDKNLYNIKINGKRTVGAIMKKNFLEIVKKSLQSNFYAFVSPIEYFAIRVKDAIKCFGIDDSLLIRILIIRDEFDIPQIKQHYK